MASLKTKKHNINNKDKANSTTKLTERGERGRREGGRERARERQIEHYYTRIKV